MDNAGASNYKTLYNEGKVLVRKQPELPSSLVHSFKE
jgi:hypothetical protein